MLFLSCSFLSLTLIHPGLRQSENADPPPDHAALHGSKRHTHLRRAIRWTGARFAGMEFSLRLGPRGRGSDGFVLFEVTAEGRGVTKTSRARAISPSRGRLLWLLSGRAESDRKTKAVNKETVTLFYPLRMTISDCSTIDGCFFSTTLRPQ